MIINRSQPVTDSDQFAETQKKDLSLEQKSEILRKYIYKKYTSDVIRYANTSMHNTKQPVSKHIDSMIAFAWSAAGEITNQLLGPNRPSDSPQQRWYENFLLKLECLIYVHDLDEAGMKEDYTALATHKDPKLKRLKQEQSEVTIEKLAKIHGSWVLDLWKEAELCKTPEAKLVRILDRAESAQFMINKEEFSNMKSLRDVEPHAYKMTSEEINLSIQKLLDSVKLLDKKDTPLIETAKGWVLASFGRYENVCGNRWTQKKEHEQTLAEIEKNWETWNLKY